jgi:putative tryptophan/tyrosine transport system substrate-binding protein
MAIHIRRRDFIFTLGGAAAAWPLAARAQQPTMPVLGVVSAGSRSAFESLLGPFRQSLKEAGFIEGQTVAFEYRFAEGRFDQLPSLAADLARRRVAVMISTGVSSSLAVKNADATIPHVFLSQDDPVRLGFVQSFNHPGGHATGVSLLTAVLAGKRVEFARQLMPDGAPLAYLANPPAPEAARYLREIKAVAHEIKQELVVVNASSPAEIDAAFTELVGKRAGALIVSTDGYLFSRRGQIIALAARHNVPAIYDRRDYAMTGGLVSYGPDLADAYRQIGIYAARILKGEKPAHLPVVQPTKFELVINLMTAKALGLNLPPTVLALADEVIE